MGTFSLWHWMIVMGWPGVFAHPIPAIGTLGLWAIVPAL